MFVESTEEQTLPPTLCQGLLTLIPKPKKDPLLIDSCRPICLLNNDYKILARIFAIRMKSVLDHIIDETQSGFMRHRHIANNIRLVLDLIDYADLCNDNRLILFLDFRKAFDSIEHDFMFQALKKLVLVLTFVQPSRPCIIMLTVQLNYMQAHLPDLI